MTAGNGKVVESGGKHKVIVAGITWEFGEREKCKKDSKVQEDGSVVTRFIFRSGTVMEHYMDRSDPNFAQAAKHGLDQKFGDLFAGETDEEDCIRHFADFSTRLSAGNWNIQKAEGISGTSLMIQALLRLNAEKPEKDQRSREVIEQRWKDAVPAVKTAIKGNPEVAAMVQKIKLERAEKKAPVDPKASQAELDALFS